MIQPQPAYTLPVPEHDRSKAYPKPSEGIEIGVKSS